MDGGPLGAAGGAIVANSFSSEEYKCTIKCPYCNKTLGVNEYGRFSFCGCDKNFFFTEDGVKRDDRVEVICPYCKGEVIIEGPGRWNCPYCEEVFNYGHEEDYEEEQQEEENFTYLLFALFAKFSKSEGRITKEHITVLEELMEYDYEYNQETKKYAIEAFRHAKDSENDFEYYCLKLNNMLKNHDDREVSRNISCGTIDSLIKIALADNKISSEEERLINIASNIFRIEKHILENIKSNYIDQNIDKYYEILGCEKGDSLNIIKSKYRKLAMSITQTEY